MASDVTAHDGISRSLIARSFGWQVPVAIAVGIGAGLLGRVVAQYGWTTLAQLGTFMGAVYLGLVVVLFGVYPASPAAYGPIDP